MKNKIYSAPIALVLDGSDLDIITMSEVEGEPMPANGDFADPSGN